MLIPRLCYRKTPELIQGLAAIEPPSVTSDVFRVRSSDLNRIRFEFKSHTVRPRRRHTARFLPKTGLLSTCKNPSDTASKQNSRSHEGEQRGEPIAWLTRECPSHTHHSPIAPLSGLRLFVAIPEPRDRAGEKLDLNKAPIRSPCSPSQRRMKMRSGRRIRSPEEQSRSNSQQPVDCKNLRQS